MNAPRRPWRPCRCRRCTDQPLTRGPGRTDATGWSSLIKRGGAGRACLHRERYCQQSNFPTSPWPKPTFRLPLNLNFPPPVPRSSFGLTVAFPDSALLPNHQLAHILDIAFKMREIISLNGTSSQNAAAFSFPFPAVQNGGALLRFTASGDAWCRSANLQLGTPNFDLLLSRHRADIACVQSARPVARSPTRAGRYASMSLVVLAASSSADASERPCCRSPEFAHVDDGGNAD